jgi:tetratricopeptide (TPR) repeat protein
MTDQLQRGLSNLKDLETLLDHPKLDPAPNRTDWLVHRKEVEQVLDTVEHQVLDLAPDLLDMFEDAEERAALADLVVRLASRSAAVLHASGRQREAQKIMDRAASLAAGESSVVDSYHDSTDAFLRLNHAWWLLHQGRQDEAMAVARYLVGGKLTGEATAILEMPKPLERAPTLFDIYGLGLRVYGSRDHRSDGTYVTTRYLTAAWIPLVPLDAYRVAPADEGYYFLEKVRPGPVARLFRIFMPLLVVGAVAGVLLHGHFSSPEYKLRGELERIAALEKSAKTKEAREAALDKLEQVIAAHVEQVSSDAIEPAARAVVRLGTADIPDRIKLGDVDSIRRFVRRFQLLPRGARQTGATDDLIKTVERWAGQLDTKNEQQAEAALRLLGDAEVLASFNVDLARVKERRIKVQRGIAARLARDWPLEALRRYAAVGEDDASAREAARLIESRFPDDPAVWLELQPELEAWVKNASGRGLHALTKTVKLKLEQARKRLDDPDHRALLSSTDEKKLAAALGKHPGDQKLAVALAQLRRKSGEAEEALKIVASLGAPGLLTSKALLLRAELEAERGRPAEAERLLSRLVAGRLPGFEAARRRYHQAITAERERLVEGARTGSVPESLARRLRGLEGQKEKQAEVFGEWVAGELKASPRLKRLRDRYTKQGDVVPAALSLGTLRVRLANQERGARRKQLLDGAERVFLAIQSEAQGLPTFHIGLGQVYHRLGKNKQGERELERVLKKDEPLLSLAVCRVYRDLGLKTRARAVAHQVFKNHEKPHRENAAVMLGLLATSNDEREQWYRKANPEDPFVKNSLLEIEADDLYRRGELAAADRRYAELVTRWGKEAEHQSASANNAALAVQRRYHCTGKLKHLDRAVWYLDAARRLEPDSALVTGNLAEAVRHRALVGILARWLKLPLLRPSSPEASTLVAALLDGELEPEVRATLARDAGFRRTLALSREEEALAPGNVRPYERQLWLLRHARDVPGLKALVSRLERVKRLDTADNESHAREIREKKQDKRFAERMRTELGRLTKLRRSVERAHHKPTLAAVWYLEGEKWAFLAYLDDRPETLARALEAYAEARRLWPALSGNLGYIHTWAALLEASRRSRTLGKMWERDRRQLGVTAFMVKLVLDKETEALGALRSAPSLSQAVALRKKTPTSRLGLSAWALARITQDAELLEKTRELLKREDLRLVKRVRARLNPTDASTKVELGLLEAKQH